MRTTTLICCFATLALVPLNAAAVQCDGTELICLNLTSQSEATSAGAKIYGAADFTTAGYKPSEQGAVSFKFGSNVDLSAGTFEVDVEGLVAVNADETNGGKVSLFDVCTDDPTPLYGLGIQKMAGDYKASHGFRFFVDKDGLPWNAVLITYTDGGKCHYSISNWQPGETHHVKATWGPAGLILKMDNNFTCTANGTGVFQPVNKTFYLANRCERFPHQQAVARFRNLRVWAKSGPTVPPTPDAGVVNPDAGVPAPDAGPATEDAKLPSPDLLANDAPARDFGTGAKDVGTPDAPAPTDLGSNATTSLAGGCSVRPTGALPTALWLGFLLTALAVVRSRRRF